MLYYILNLVNCFNFLIFDIFYGINCQPWCKTGMLLKLCYWRVFFTIKNTVNILLNRVEDPKTSTAMFLYFILPYISSRPPIFIHLALYSTLTFTSAFLKHFFTVTVLPFLIISLFNVKIWVKRCWSNISCNMILNFFVSIFIILI